jgi:hypothetical protein
MARYRVCEFRDGDGQTWFQVGYRAWCIFWRWDCEWPWQSGLVATYKNTPRLFATAVEAFERVDELEARDRMAIVRLVRVVERPREPVEHADITYSMAGLVTQSEPPAETTTATKRPGRTGKRKPKGGKS